MLTSRSLPLKMGLHRLLVGTWTKPGAIFTFEFDDEKLTLNLLKKTDIPEDEPMSWMTFDVCTFPFSSFCKSLFSTQFLLFFRLAF